MNAKVIDGKELSATLRLRLKKEVEELKSKGINPGLAVIIVGEDPASQTYVANKIKACAQVGINSKAIRLKESTREEELLAQINDLNQDPNIHGILVQLPLPAHISEHKVLQAIRPEKDVDGFHPNNVGKMMIGEPCLLPCTPHGVLKMIQSTGIEIAGKQAVIVGRSNIVGKPVAMLLLRENATVTIAHSQTKHLQAVTKSADILVVATGRAGMIGKEDVKEGAIVIDVGINRNEEGKLVGDVRYDEVREVASYITPVPGGVGPMTITMLLSNTLEAAQHLHNL